jgi:hypothetical protein
VGARVVEAWRQAQAVAGAAAQVAGGRQAAGAGEVVGEAAAAGNCTPHKSGRF